MTNASCVLACIYEDLQIKGFCEIWSNNTLQILD
jgi:hypothetical protein